MDLPAGEHTLSEMQRRGVSERPSFGAIRVTPGFEATLFEFSNFEARDKFYKNMQRYLLRHRHSSSTCCRLATCS